MPSAQEMIRQAYEISGILGEVDDLSAANAQFGLTRLNAMLDSWRTDRLFCYQLLEESFALTANQGSYTIGSGADFDTDRPLDILDPCYVRENNIDYPVQVVTKTAFKRIVAKSTVTSNYPEELFYEPAFPTGTILLYPVPSAANTLFINSLKTLQEFDTLTESLSLPPGYQEAIEYNLAIRLAAKKGFPINIENKKIAAKAIGRIKRTNDKPIVARIEIETSRRRQAHIEADA